MKRILFVLAVVFVASLRAQAPEPMPLARGNTNGEPHHHLKIENEYIRAYYVEVPPHESTQLHQHDHDYLFVTLGDSDVVNAVRDKPEVRLVLKDGETHLVRGGFAHVARNLNDAPFHNITIELLKPQTFAHNVCGPVMGSGFAACDPVISSYEGVVEFETAEISLSHMWLSSGAKHNQKSTKLAFLVVGLSGARIKIKEKGKPPEILRNGEIAWVAPGSNLEFSCDGTKAAEFLELTLKSSDESTKP